MDIKVGFASLIPEYLLALEGFLPNYTLLTPYEPHWKSLVHMPFVHSPARVKSTLDFLLTQEARRFLASQEDVHLLLFKSSFQVEQICQSLGVRILSAPSSISRKLENKLFLSKIMKDSSIPLLEQEEIILEPKNLLKKTSFRYPLVAQYAKGFGGNSTFLVEDPKDWCQLPLERGSKRVKITPYKEGFTLTINGVVMDKQVVVGSPFLQLTGIPSITPKRMAACGNDFNTSWIPLEILKGIQKKSITVGEIISQQGFQGFFGLDWLWVPSEGFYLIEINPRFTGNIHLSTKIQTSLGETPLIYYHLAHFLHWKALPIQNKPYSAVGAQLILHSFDPGSYWIQNTPKGGIYSLPEMTFLRKGYSLEDIQNPKEVLVQPLPKGFPTGYGKEVGRLVFRRTISNGKEIDPEIQKIAKWFYKSLEFQKRQKAA